MNIRHMFKILLAGAIAGSCSVATAAGEEKGGSGIAASFMFRDLPDNAEAADPVYVICYDANVVNGKDDNKKEVKLAVVAKAGEQAGKYKCLPWNGDITPSTMSKFKRILIVIRTNDADFLESEEKLSVSVSSQSVASVSDVRPQVAFAVNATSPDKAAVSKKYFLLWPYELTPGATTTVSVSISSTRDEKSVAAGTDWLLPAVPTKYHFGIMPGIAWSTVKTHSAGYAAGSTATSFTPEERVGSHLIDPALFLSWYWRGMNPAASPNLDDQALVFGVSLKEPTGRFYLGYSFEPIRNVALVFGGNAAKVTRLASGFDGGPSDPKAAPPSKEKFDYGLFVSVAFNFSAFLQQALGAGK